MADDLKNGFVTLMKMADSAKPLAEALGAPSHQVESLVDALRKFRAYWDAKGITTDG